MHAVYQCEVDAPALLAFASVCLAGLALILLLLTIRLSRIVRALPEILRATLTIPPSQVSGGHK